MKIIITESQFNSIVPPPLRRRLNNMVDIMNDVMLNYGMYLDIDDYTEDDFVDYVIDTVIQDTFPNVERKDYPSYSRILKPTLEERIRSFWFSHGGSS
jgi:hypothetical protein